MRAVYLGSIWLHVLAAMTWVGGMVLFVVAVMPYFRARPEAEKSAFLEWFGPRFRITSWVCFAVLAVTGTFNLWARGVRFDDLLRSDWWTTGFGHVLAAKLVLVALAAGASRCAPVQPSEARPVVAPAHVQKGEWFKQTGCADCHSIAAYRIFNLAAIGPDLSEAVEDVPRRFGRSLDEFLQAPTGTMSMVLSTRIPLTPEQRALARRKAQGGVPRSPGIEGHWPTCCQPLAAYDGRHVHPEAEALPSAGRRLTYAVANLRRLAVPRRRGRGHDQRHPQREMGRRHVGRDRAAGLTLHLRLPM